MTTPLVRATVSINVIAICRKNAAKIRSLPTILVPSSFPKETNTPINLVIDTRERMEGRRRDDRDEYSYRVGRLRRSKRIKLSRVVVVSLEITVETEDECHQFRWFMFARVHRSPSLPSRIDVEPSLKRMHLYRFIGDCGARGLRLLMGADRSRPPIIPRFQPVQRSTRLA